MTAPAVDVLAVKLRYADAHVRIALRGTAAGVDLRGDDARAAFELARPLVGWLDAREPGLRVRSISLDRIAARALVTIDDGGARPRVVRVDPPDGAELFALAEPLFAYAAARAAEKLAARV